MKCEHLQQYCCKICKNCCQCKHIYVERADGWWARCPNMKWHKCEGSGCCHGLGPNCKVCGRDR